MRITLAALLSDAWALFRREADLLLRVGGLFLFVPTYALLLLVGPLPLPDPDIADTQARAQAWVDKLDIWVGNYGLGSVGAYAITWFGTALIFCLLLDRTRPTVGEGLKRTAILFPRFLLAMVVVSIPSGAGMYLLLLPGLWLMSRLALAGPILFADAPIGAVAAVGRSWRLTRKAQWSLLGAIVTVYLAAMLSGQPFMLLARWLGGTVAEGGGQNPIAVAIVHALAAGVAMLAQIAGALIAVAAYRRVSAAG